MSEEEATPAEAPEKPASKVRRISNPRPKKQTGESKPEAQESVPAAEPVEVPPPAEAEADDSWADIEAETQEAGQGSSEAKRKRRRRKGKGGSQSGSSPSGAPEAEAIHPLSAAEPTESVPATVQPVVLPSRPPQGNRPQLDPELVGKKAWKIFLAEVSEEGVALITDQDARDLSRRCFRLAEIFLEERGRRR